MTGSGTPEKKLLNIIEESKDASGGAVKSKAVKTLNKKSGPSFALALPPAILSFTAFFKKKKGGSAGNLFETELKKINLLILAGIIGIFVYGIFYYLNYRTSPERYMENLLDDIKRSFNSEKRLSLIAMPVLETDYIDMFLDKVRRRNLFKSISAQEKEKSMLDEVQTKVMEALKNYKLVGVSSSPNPQESYAMVEDLASKVTYFLKKNDMIAGMQVQGIESNRVVLSYLNQEFELQ